MIKVGILGGAGYTAGELIRLLINHPEAEIAFVHSESNAGNRISDVHAGLIGDTDLRFTSAMPFEEVDVVFFCFGHGKSAAFLSEHAIPDHVRIIDLAQDFRCQSQQTHPQPLPVREGLGVGLLGLPGGAFIYGLPELNRKAIAGARCVANPGCFATAIQLALLPAAKAGLLTQPVSVNAITGSTGAGQKPTATTHFSWRTGNMSIYKPFRHQHLAEIYQSLNRVAPLNPPKGGKNDGAAHPTFGGTEGGISIDFLPYRGDFARGIFCTAVVRLDRSVCCDPVATYQTFYADEPFTHYTDRPVDLKQVVNTNKCLVHADVIDDKLLVTSAIDNLLKGAVGQAVENMNLMFGLNETIGLRLKPNAF